MGSVNFICLKYVYNCSMIYRGEKTMKFRLYYSLIIFVLVFTVLMNCGKSPLEEGDKAYREGNYGLALQHYFQAIKDHPDDPGLKTRIATAFFKQGEIVYQRGKVIRAFEDRIQRGEKYLPDSLSEDLQHTLSDTYYKLALAYKNGSPENPYQKKKYFENTLDNLEKSLEYNPENQEAASTLQSFKNQHFQEMLNKGKLYYSKGKQDALQYLAADYYLKNALKMNPASKEAARYLRLIRTRALNLLDPGQQVPIAVTDMMENGKYRAFLVVVQNQTPQNLPVRADNFFLIAEDGQAYPGKVSEIFSTPLNPITLPNGKETTGVVAFPLVKQKKFVRLEFRSNGKVLGYKDLP